MEQAHPILALWAHPRSLSTVTERIMRERGDMTVFHEPFMADYYTRRGRPFPMLETGGETWISYAEMRDRIMAAADTGPVFFKDMSYYVQARLAKDPIFARRCKNLFLIRDPRRTIASYWRKDPECSLEEIGIEAQWHHLQYLNTIGADHMVIQAEALANDPTRVMARVWDWASLPFVDAFVWAANETPKGWSHVAGWHPEVIGSTNLMPDAGDPDQIFETAAKQAPHLREYLAHHQPFYDRLKAFCENSRL